MEWDRHAYDERLLLEGMLASCWCSLCARLDLPKYLELGLPHLAISTSLVCRSHRTWEQDIAQTNSPDRSRTAFARAMAGRFVKHLFKVEPDARCHTVATILPRQAQPNTPGVCWHLGRLAALTPARGRRRHYQTSLCPNHGPSSESSTAGNGPAVAMHGVLRALLSLPGPRTWRQRWSQLLAFCDFPAEAVTRQVATSWNAPAIFHTIVLQPISSSTMATRLATTWGNC